jgi:hypothetical protein
MANNNSITITLNANAGQASAVITGLSNQINRDLSGSLGRATIGANLMTSAISIGLQSVGKLASKAIGLFNQAASTQTSVISTAGNIMKMTGYNFKQATSFVEDFQTQMSKVAASLPGVAEDFAGVGRAILDDVIPNFVGLDGKLDSIERSKALEKVKQISTWTSLLGQGQGLTPAAIGKSVSAFLSKSKTIGELYDNDLFQNNSNFRGNINEALTGNRNATLAELNTAYRSKSKAELQEILLKAAEQSQEVLDALSESVSGVFGLVNDSIFGLSTGIFGLMRDLDTKQDGTQTALKSINVVLLSLFGPTGLFSESSKTLAGLGIILGDPMKGLQDGANKFTNSIKSLTSIFNQFNSRNPGQTLDDAKETLVADLQFFFGNLFKFDGIGSDLAGITNNFISFLNEVNWTELFQYLGERLAQAFNELADFIINLDYGKTIEALLKGIGGMFMGLARLLSKLNWGKVILALGTLIGGALLAATAAALLAPVAGIIAAVAGIGLIIVAALEAFGFNWDEMWGGLTGVWNSITSTITGFFNAIDNFFKDIKKKFDEWNPQSNAGKGAKTAIGVATEVSNPLTGGPFGYLYRLFTGGNKTPNAYNGLNTASLMNAANKELYNAPPGAGLVMANSSETILNSSQQARIMSAMNSKPGITIGAINIHTAATNAQEIAKDVVACIERELQSFGQNYVAAPVV